MNGSPMPLIRASLVTLCCLGWPALVAALAPNIAQAMSPPVIKNGSAPTAIGAKWLVSWFQAGPLGGKR